MIYKIRKFYIFREGFIVGLKKSISENAAVHERNPILHVVISCLSTVYIV